MEELEAEALRLGIVDAASLEELRDIVSPDMFRGPGNAEIFAALLNADMNGERDQLLSKVAAKLGIPGRLESILETTPTGTSARALAYAIRDAHRMEKLRAVALRIAHHATSDDDREEILDSAEAEVLSIRKQQGLTTVEKAAQEFIDGFVHRIKSDSGLKGLPTGLLEFDRRIGGLQRGALYVIGHRPGMGGTRLLNQCVLGICGSGHSALYFSPGRARSDVAQGLACAYANVSSSDLNAGRTDQWNALTEGTAAVAQLPLRIDDSPQLGTPHIRNSARRLSRKPEGLSAIAIDDVRMIRERRFAGNREAGFLEVLYQLKSLARELDVPVILTHKLSDWSERRNTKDKRPQLHDFSEEGVVGIADAVFFVYRDDYYFEDSPDKGQVELIVAKNSDGPVGTAKVKFNPATGKYSNLASDEYSFDDEFADFSGPPLGEEH